jgi:hypothetical protein
MSSNFERGFTEELDKLAVDKSQLLKYNPKYSPIRVTGRALGEQLGRLGDPYQLGGAGLGALMGYHLGSQYGGGFLPGLAGAAMGGLGGYGAGGMVGDYMKQQRGGASGQAASGFKMPTPDWVSKTPAGEKPMAAAPSAGSPDMTITLNDIRKFNKSKAPQLPTGPDMTITPRDLMAFDRSQAGPKPSSYLASAPATTFM